jgi:NAD+ kinase
MLSSRPIILPPNKIITSQYIVEDDSDASAKVIIDGQAAWEMYAGDILEVQTAEHPLQLITSKKRDYFTILRNKLKWGSND